MKSLQLLVVIFAVVGTTFAQEVAESIIVPVCGRDDVADIDTASYAARLNRGDLSNDAGRDRAAASFPEALSFAPPPLRCEDGPKKIIHTVPNEFHWPPIWRGSCDKLFCNDPPCFARSSVWRFRCVHVFKIDEHGNWVYAGRQIRRYIDHTECGCKECTDIRTRRECIATKPCPNPDTKNSFCYWTPFILPTIKPVLTAEVAEPASAEVAAAIPVAGRCRCCKPFPCKEPFVFDDATCSCVCRLECPPGQILNKKTCDCECPPGSKKNPLGICVGDCEEISTKHCKFTICEDNTHFKCEVVNDKCTCPSCDSANAYQCQRTRCLEQPMKKRCYLEPFSHKCRCPTCRDQTDEKWCESTFCGPNNHLKCKWNPWFRVCGCPH